MTGPDPDNADFSAYVRRPPGQLLNYSVEMRWQLTRRHPYYLAFWRHAQRYYDNPAVNDREQLAVGYAARLCLGSIGVGGRPVPPDWPFEKLTDDNPDPTFLAGSLQPITIRSLVVALMGQLDPPTLKYIARTLDQAADCRLSTNISEADRKLLHNTILQAFLTHEQPTLDKVLGSPVFYMHAGASQATIVADTERQVRIWKVKLGLSSPRIHTEKLPHQLAVWDRFEGWADGRYDLDHEQTLEAIGLSTRAGRSTVHKRYKAAFEAVIGVPFSVEAWYRTMGLLMMHMDDGAFAAAVVERRRVNQSSSTAVPEATIGNDRVVETKSAAPTDAEVVQLFLSIKELIAAGQSDEAIRTSLGLSQPMVAAIAKVRKQNMKLSELQGE